MKPVLYLFVTAAAIACFLATQKAPAQDNYETRTSVGQQIPSFALADLTGSKIDSADLKGRVVVLNFWATWCGPCQAELPRLQKEVWETYKSDGLAVIGISRGEKTDEVKPFAAKIGLTYRIAVDTDRKLYDRFASAGIPRTYVIDRTGKIVFQSLGYEAGEFNKMKQVVQHELSIAASK